MSKYLGVTPGGVWEQASEINDLTGKPLAMDATGRFLPVVDENRDSAECFITVGEDGRLMLVDPPNTYAISQVAGGANYSLFLSTQGKAYSCGQNIYCQLGRKVDSGSDSFCNLGLIDNLPAISQLVTNESMQSTYLIAQNGSVYSCGVNSYGQLGRNVANGSPVVINIGKISDLPPIQQVVLTINSVYFLAIDGIVYSCGSNAYGQLGRAVDSGSSTNTNLGAIAGIPPIKKISANRNSTFLLSSEGEVYSCGHNHTGQLGRVIGNGSTTTNNLGLIENLPTIIDISSSGVVFDSETASASFLTSDGFVYNCGANNRGQLGRVCANGSGVALNLGRLDDLKDIVGIAMSATPYNDLAGRDRGSTLSVFITEKGEVYNCGGYIYGELGRSVDIGSQTVSNLGKIDGLPPVAQTFLFNGASFFLTVDGAVFNCGNNSYGQLGRESANGSATKDNLGLIESLPPIKQISYCRLSSLFLTFNGSVYSAGYNSVGELGRIVPNGSTTSVNLGEIDSTLFN